MKSRMAVTILILIAMTFMASCQGDSGPKPDLVVWTGMADQELEVLESVTSSFNEKNGVYVQVVKVPFNELKIKYQIAAPAGEGPDLVIGPQDWIGFLATAELIEPLTKMDFTEDQQKPYNPVSLENLTYKKRIYGLPLFMETIAVIYNKNLVEYEPRTMDELLDQAVKFSVNDRDKYGFFFEATNLYFAWPFLSGYGAEIFGSTGSETDVSKITVNTPEMVNGMRFLANLKKKYDLLPSGATTDMMSGVFYEKRMPFCLNGPWMLGELRKNEIGYEVIPIPRLPNGKKPRPFVGVQGMMLNPQCLNKRLAVRFMHFVNEPENQKKLCLASGRIPSRYDTLNIMRDTPAIQKFAEAAEQGTPMPNHPAMNAVWAPMNEALELVLEGGKDPQEVLPETVKRIKEDIRIMME